MRLNINLASQPHEEARQYRRRISALVAVLVGITALLLCYIIYQRIHSRGINRQIADVRRQINGLDAEEAQARAILSRPQNRVIADQSEFLNELFARKALSWTRVFTEMEKIVPPNLHVVSMKPEYNRTGDLIVHVVVATDSRDRAIELMRRMEKSNHFRQTQVVAENMTTLSSGDQSAGGGNIQFDIAAIYIPNAPDNDAAASEETRTDAASAENPIAPSGHATAPSRRPGQQPANPVQAQNQALRERGH